jgi:hypothetical protein
MSTNPSTPITRTSNVWSAELSAALTDEMLSLINKSPTLRSQLNQLSDEISASNSNVKAIQLKPSAEIGSSQYAADTNTLFIAAHDLTPYGSFSAAARFVGILAHEMGHRVDDANLDYANTIYGVDGKDEQYASIGVHSEGVAAANTYIVRKEILQTLENNGGPEIYFPGAEYAVTTNPYGLIAALTAINNSIPTWSASEQLAVFSEVGANYLANVLTGGGTPPGTQTNWEFYLNSSRGARGLPPAPAPQPNSVELVDINNDGIIEYIQYRDSLNICHREDYTTTPTGDHVTTESTYTAGFNSPLASREVITTNAAGTVITDALDSNADGIVDKTTTTVDADHNGIAERNTVAVTGGDTTVSEDANQNGSAEYITVTHVNAQIDLTQTDENAQPWTTAITHWDALGRADTQTYYWDDGRRTVVDWDQTDASSATSQSNDGNENYASSSTPAQGSDFAWSQIKSEYDSHNNLASQDIWWDNGARIKVDYDEANAGTWRSITEYYDAAGRLDERVWIDDDNRREVVDYDEANDKSWSYTVLLFNADGTKDYQWIVNDNGTSILTDWNTFTSSGQPDQNDCDVYYYDAAGQVDYMVFAIANGNRLLVDYDQSNTHPWARVGYEYNPSGQMVSETVTVLDGVWSYRLNPYTNPDTGAAGFTPNLSIYSDPTPSPIAQWREPYYADSDWESVWWPLP